MENKKIERINMRIAPEVKEMAQERARQEHRALSNYIESLILKDYEKQEQARTKSKQ